MLAKELLVVHEPSLLPSSESSVLRQYRNGVAGLPW